MSTTDFPERLLAGYSKYKKGMQASERDQLRELAGHGQKPETLVISCCDSRATPEAIFNAGPGEIFVVRNVANLAPANEHGGTNQSTSAALEFAVQALKVKNIVVLGHALCGGIKAALGPAGEPLSPGNFIGNWIEPLAPLASAVNAESQLTAEERQTALERVSIRQSIDNLRTFPWIKSLEDQGQLKLYGAWFDISSGDLWTMDPETGEFARQN